MQIRQIVVHVVDTGLEFSLGDRFQLGQELLLVEVHTDTGVTGLGGTSTYGNGEELALAIERLLWPLLRGAPLWELENFWSRALKLTKLYAPPQAAAAVDCAIWDALGRAHGVPAYRLLGGRNRPLPVYASLPAYPSVEACLTEMDLRRGRGITAFKLHLSGIVPNDLELIRAARDRVGDTVELLADAVGHYEYTDALIVGRALQDAGFGWFEMPVEDYSGEIYGRLVRELRIPITTGEVTNPTLAVAADAVLNRRWDIIRVDACNWGGITQGRKVAALAEAFGLQCEFHAWGYMVNQLANAHLMLASPNARYFEMPVPEDDFGFGFEPLTIRDGFLTLSEDPGLGLRPDWHAISDRIRLSRKLVM